MISKKNYPYHLHRLGCAVILLGLFFSRAMMSVGMITLVLAALMHGQLKEQVVSFFKNRDYLLFSGYAVVMAITGLWSQDLAYFLQRITIMLPFLFLPFSFYVFKEESKDWAKWALWAFLLCIVLGNSISLYQYFSHKELYDASYGFSKVIPTPFKNDHIRYSLAVSIGCAVLLYGFQQTKVATTRIIYVVLFVFFTVYLHILSSKTGLVCFYLVCILYVISFFLNRKRWKYGLVLVLLGITLPIISYRFSTTFRYKLAYLRYSLNEMRNNNQQANVSDEGRIISYQYAWEVIQPNPLLGIGLGDVYHEMDIRFKRDFPQRTEEPLLPHNQFIMVLMSGGIFALFYFAWMQWRWFKRMKRHGFLHVAIFSILFFGILIEPLFETQYGTCIYVLAIFFSDTYLANTFILKESV